LSLKTIEDGIGSLATNKPKDGAAIFGVLRRAEIDHSRAVTAEQKKLKKYHDGRGADRDTGI